jgi:carboxyl-terminal processing protease
VDEAGRRGTAMVRRLLLLVIVVGVIAPWALAVEGLAWGGRPAAIRTFDALVELFRREYWNPDHVDWDAWADAHRERVVSAETRSAFDAALRRMVRSLNDDHSSWSGLPNHASASALEEPLQLPDPPPRLGVQFAFVTGRGLVVERVFPDTPAARAGLQRGDVIVAVGGQPLRDRGGLADANEVLIGALEGGRVELAVERRRASLLLEVVAAPVAFADASVAPFATMLDPTTGYLAIPSFNAAGIGGLAHARLRELMADGAVNLVLDLRGNLGGRLVELGLVLGAFTDGVWAEAVAHGRVAWRARYERDREGGVARLVDGGGMVLAEARLEDPVRFRGSVVVIVSGDNASAGEIAALALQDLGVARVVGEPTAGNVEAIRGFSLPDGSRVLIAVANMRGAHGLDFDAGVVPDVLAQTSVGDLARGFDPAVAEARRLLGALPFTPDRHF